MRILVVEDEFKTSQYLKKGLTEAGYVVDVAGDGVDGLHMAVTGAYDLVILDVMLPGKSGWQVLDQLRAQQDTAVLFLTARDDLGDRVKG
ncbi:response regulator, partial [Pandoraea sp. ISTKB]